MEEKAEDTVDSSDGSSMDGHALTSRNVELIGDQVYLLSRDHYVVGVRFEDYSSKTEREGDDGLTVDENDLDRHLQGRRDDCLR